MEKRTFVLLCNLLDVTFDGETAEQKANWRANVLNSVGSEGYSIADASGRYITKQFSTDEIEFETVSCYNFAGSAFEEERFYAADWLTVREKATGDIYAYETETLYDF